MSATQPVTLTDATFETAVAQSDQPVLIDFWAPWCGPCNVVAPVIDALAAEYDGKARIAKLNVDENPQVSRRLNIRSIPTLMVFKDGEVVETVVGVRPKAQVEELLNAHV
ncbi:MAG: thioredoxin [Gammaproteobacteria bacterium]|nr:thioredoxin [Gammaproteobacteria bacterium]